MSVGEDTRSGQPSTSTNDDHVERVCAVIHGNLCLTVQEVADEVGISIGSCHQIFTEKLQMCCASAKFMLCTSSCIAPHPQLSGKTSDIRCAPSTLFSGLNPNRLIPDSQT
jgi:AraC-like DNA-binding protein